MAKNARAATVGLAAAALVAAACTGGGSARSGASVPPRSGSSGSASGGSTSGVTTRWPIKHVVFVMMENHSFDDMFGTFPGADGTRFGVLPDGRRIRLHHEPDRLPVDLPHSFVDGVRDINGGKMNGWPMRPDDLKYAFSQFRASDIPNYWRWAHRFVLSDRFFSSEHGPSFPNHLYAVAARSGGTEEGPAHVKLFYSQETGLGIKHWGCDASKNEIVRVFDPEGNYEAVKPCFDFPTLGDQMIRAGIPWKMYAPDDQHRGYIWSMYDAIRSIRYTRAWQEHVFSLDHMFTDLESGMHLPAVTWIVPDFGVSEHPLHSMCAGENWSTKIIDDIMRGPDWGSTAIFLTWDEWGGFYDHVPPPNLDYLGPGIRVPLLILSPYAKSGYIDHTPEEFSSVLRFMEDDFGLKPMTKRDRGTANMAEAFDFTQAPLPALPLPLRTCPPSGGG